MIAGRRLSALDYWDSPLGYIRDFWPSVSLYHKQEEILRALVRDDEVVVPAGNMLGKDYVAGLAAIWFFLTRHPCRVVTTSVKDDHLSVLWGEIGRHIRDHRFPLNTKQGGPLDIKHHEIRKVLKGVTDPLSYIKGMVAAEGAAMQGHHIAQQGDGIPRTLFIVDEASGVPDKYYTMASTWANRILIIGNPWPTSNFFYRAVEGRPGTEDRGGDLPRANGSGFHRKVIKITVRDSPNVRWAEHEIAKGKQPTGRVIVPGVKGWSEYQKNLKLWDKPQQTVSLWAEFDKSGFNSLFPGEWLDLCESLAVRTTGDHRSSGRKTMGVDSAMGGDNTSWVILDRQRLYHLQSEKTRDTSTIPGITIGLMREYGIRPEDVLFDAGGGGRVHADSLRRMGYPVRSVGFGESVRQEPKHGITTIKEKKGLNEERYVFKNRRAQMYGMASELVEPIVINGIPEAKFAIPSKLLNLRRSDGGPSLRGQLIKIPKKFDGEGRLVLPPKQATSAAREEDNLIAMIGCSPDEADAFCLAVFGQMERRHFVSAGAAH